MKKIGILTIVDGYNYGNRLQNYATQEILKELGCYPITLINKPRFNNRFPTFLRIKKYFGQIYDEIFRDKENKNRKHHFKEFNKYIKFSNRCISIYKQIDETFDYFIAGSDQIWKPTYERLSEMDLLSFAKPNKRISFSASFGISKFPENYPKKEIVKRELKKFKAISVREDRGKEIVESLTDRKDVEVLVDPTMLLTQEKWDEVSKKPDMLKTDKYILNYFLGDLSKERKKEIDRVASENNCEVINILDKESPFYECGPSEFLYLEKHAFLICTDSFHSSVFAIIYKTPFLVFEREDNRVNMNSRIETLLSKFKLEKRKYNGKITKDDFKCEYQEPHKILDEERKKAEKFLRNALNIKDCD